MADTAVLIPALNCAATIGAVVRGVRRYVREVLVVNDGSTDATTAEATAAGATVVSHSRARGKGAALLTGMRTLAEHGVQRVLTMDGDGQHLADEIPVLLHAADAEPRTLIIGCRHFESTGAAPINLFGNRFANRWVRIACGQAIPDTQSGFRIYPLAATLRLGVRARHFAFETEVLIRAARARIPIRSVRVKVYYPPADQRTSHYRKVMDTVRIIFVVLGLILRVW